MKWTRIALVTVTIGLVAFASSFYWRTRLPEAAVIAVPVEAHSVPAVQHANVITALLPKRTRSTAKISSAPFKGTYSRSNAPGDLAQEATAEALAGSSAAMLVLGTALHECARANMGSDDEIEVSVAKRSLGRDVLASGQTGSDPARDAAEAKRLEAIRDSCSQISKSASDRWLDWLEKAAVAGDSEARVAFAWSALQDYATPQAQEENAEEYVRRRDEAFDMLQDSIANGDCSNGILNGFRKVSPDPVTQYVYEGLLLQHTLDDFSSGRFPVDYVNLETQSLNATLSNLAAGVPLEQRGLAQATTRDILQNYCTQF